MLISSHILDELSKLATHYGFLDGGCMVREMSAEELEQACLKCVRLRVSDLRALCRTLDGMELDYSVSSDCEADVYGAFSLSQLALALADSGCEIESFHEHDETLESFYISLMGGERHAWSRVRVRAGACRRSGCRGHSGAADPEGRCAPCISSCARILRGCGRIRPFGSALR